MMVQFLLSLLLAATLTVPSAATKLSGGLMMGFTEDPVDPITGEPLNTCTTDQLRLIATDIYFKIVAQLEGVSEADAKNVDRYYKMRALATDLKYIDEKCSVGDWKKNIGNAIGNANGLLNRLSNAFDAAKNGNAYGLLQRLSNGMDGSRVDCSGDTVGGRRDLLLDVEEDEQQDQDERRLQSSWTCPPGCTTGAAWVIDPGCWGCEFGGYRRNLRGDTEEAKELTTADDESHRRLTADDESHRQLTSYIETLEECASEGVTLCLDLDLDGCVQCSSFRCIMV